MGFAEFVLFIKSLPEMVNVLKNINESINTLTTTIKNDKLDEFKGEIYAELDKLILAKNDTDRKNGIVALSKRIAGK